jgi:hypothetical protein
MNLYTHNNDNTKLYGQKGKHTTQKHKHGELTFFDKSHFQEIYCILLKTSGVRTFASKLFSFRARQNPNDCMPNKKNTLEAILTFPIYHKETF